MEFSQIKQLAKAAINNTSLTFSNNGESKEYSAAIVNEALRNELNNYMVDFKTFRRHKTEIFELLEETVDEVLPNKVMQAYEQFAEVKTIPQGDQQVFKIRITEAARKRLKACVTRVGLAGRYETGMLDGTSMVVTTSAVGYGIRLGFEEFLDGRYSFADFSDIMVEGLNEYIYAEIEKALASAIKTLPAKNQVSHTAFDASKMDQLLAIADSYGSAASTIYCTAEFAATMLPGKADMLSDSIKDELARTGRLASYKGHNIVILPQSMTDATNSEKVIDPSNAYIFPSITEKPVKIVFEGQTCIQDMPTAADWSKEIQTYKKVGVGVLTNPGICSYKNTSLAKKLA